MIISEKAARTRRLTEIDKFIGARVKSARLSLGWSQSDLAQELGITFQQVQKYENGTNRVSAATLFSISKLFKVPLQYFFDQPVPSEVEVRLGAKAMAVTSSREVRLLRAFRETPENLRRRFLALLEVITGEEHEETTD